MSKHTIHTGYSIGPLVMRLPGEIEAETAEFIDRAAKLFRHRAARGRVTNRTKLGDLMALPVEPSGKALGDLTWPEMQAAYDHLAQRARELNAPFRERVEAD